MKVLRHSLIHRSKKFKLYTAVLFVFLLAIAFAGCTGSDGGGGGGTIVIDNTVTPAAVAGVWKGTWDSDFPGGVQGEWCAEIAQGGVNIIGTFNITNLPSDTFISGSVIDPALPAPQTVANATVYIPDPGGANLPSMRHPFVGTVGESSIEFTSPAAGDVDFTKGVIRSNPTTASGDYASVTPADSGTWDGGMDSNAPECLPCAPPITSFITYTCTDENGEFVLDSTDAINPVPTVKAFKGSQKGNEDNVVHGRDDVVIELGAPAKIAVVTGRYDRIEDLLAKFGMGGDVDNDYKLVLGSEVGFFDLYDGVNLVEGVADNQNSLDNAYPDFDELFIDSDGINGEDIYDYEIVFINCGNSFENALLTDPDVITILQNYVAGGGELYITDRAYDFIEEAFPSYIDFWNEGPLHSAEQGRSGLIEGANLHDAPDNLLPQWLQLNNCVGYPCVTYNGVLYESRIEGFKDGWAVIDRIDPAPPSPVKVWVNVGDVYLIGGIHLNPKDTPLMVSFDVGAGTILYSSYHTHGADIAGYAPQERILEYFVFYLLNN